MKTDALHILSKLNTLFPIDRTGTKFEGNHHLTMDEHGTLNLNIWTRKPDDKFRINHIEIQIGDLIKPEAAAWDELQDIVYNR
jgi:hypothetical protein